MYNFLGGQTSLLDMSGVDMRRGVGATRGLSRGGSRVEGGAGGRGCPSS